MVTIGLTGGIGSGKTSASNFFYALGSYLILNTDLMAKQVIVDDPSIGLTLKKWFGEDIFNEGKLNLSKARSVFFSDKHKLFKVNQLIHPKVKRIVEQAIKANEGKYHFAIIESAILFESSFDTLCTYIVQISAPVQQRIKRIHIDRGLDLKIIHNIIAMQSTDKEKEAKSDVVVYNNELELFLPKLYQLHQSFKNL